MAIVRRRSVAMLDSMVTMDELAVSFHSWRPSSSRSNGLKKGQPGPVKGKVHSTRSKQMVLVFFDNRGVLDTKSQNIPEVGFVRRWAVGVLGIWREGVGI